MVREYIFPDQADQQRKEFVKSQFSQCRSVEERKAVFLIFIKDNSYRGSVLHQAMKESGINIDFTLKDDPDE